MPKIIAQQCAELQVLSILSESVIMRKRLTFRFTFLEKEALHDSPSSSRFVYRCKIPRFLGSCSGAWKSWIPRVHPDRSRASGHAAGFSSVYAKGVFLVPGSCYDVEYPARLAEICNSIRAERAGPRTLSIGAATLSRVAGHSEELASTARFLISPPEVLDRANDKRAVAELAQTLNIPIPEEFDCREDRLPPRFSCSDKAALRRKSSACTQKNVIVKVYQESDFAAAYSKMARFDPEPVVQELLTGDGVGVSAVMDQNSRPVSVVCHRRIREYPIEGGPSRLLRKLLGRHTGPVCGRTPSGPAFRRYRHGGI